MRLFSKIYFMTIVAGTWSPVYSHAVTFPITPMSELGVQMKKIKTGALETFEFFDTKNKHTIIYQYDAHHIMESLEIRDELGKSLEKTRFLKNRIWKQTPLQLDEWVTGSKNKGFHRLTELSGKKRVLQ